MRKFLSALTVMAVMAVSVSAQKIGVEQITSANVTEIGDLTQIAYDFQIHPLKGNRHIDRIGGIKSWNDGKVMLARNGNSDKVMRFDNYEYKGVVDGLGKPEQYYFIEDFSYDEANNCIYIENDNYLVTYDANTFQFKGRQEVNLQIQNILNLGDKMLYFGYLTDEYTAPRYSEDKVVMPKESMIIVDRDERDLTKGTILYRESSYERQRFGYPELFFVNPKNYSTCLPGNVNTIVTFNDLEKVTEVYKFKLGSHVIPQKYVDILKQDEISIEDYSTAVTVLGALGEQPSVRLTYNIMVENGVVSFRTAYNFRDEFPGSYSPYLYWVHKRTGTKVYKHLRIPGLKFDIDPTGANGVYQVAVIDNFDESMIDTDVPMSPLGQQIVDAMKNQTHNNPVILEFRFK